MIPHVDYNVRVLAQEPSAAYIRSVLSQDRHLLGITLAEEFKESCGIIQTLLPPNLPRHPEENFEWGGMTSEHASKKWIISLIVEFLKGSPDHLLVIQDTFLKRDNLEEWHKPWAYFHESDMYYLLPADSSPETIGRVLRFAITLPWTIAVLTTLPAPERDQLLNAEKIESNILIALGKNTTAIILGGVYDDEGYLVWNR